MTCCGSFWRRSRRDPSVTQRRLATSLGLSIGSGNWHLKPRAGKGRIALRQAPVKRWLCDLTPVGHPVVTR